jgi:hypothetical protein
MALLSKAIPGKIYWKRVRTAPYDGAKRETFWRQVDVISVGRDSVRVTVDFGPVITMSEREFGLLYAKRSGEPR